MITSMNENNGGIAKRIHNIYISIVKRTVVTQLKTIFCVHTHTHFLYHR